ncbi:hypothetical protein U1Q18_006552 [Sarracenia purpurea var. burkii]
MGKIIKKGEIKENSHPNKSESPSSEGSTGDCKGKGEHSLGATHSLKKQGIMADNSPDPASDDGEGAAGRSLNSNKLGNSEFANPRWKDLPNMEISSHEGNGSESEPLRRKGESKGRESLVRSHPESSHKTTEPEISQLLNATHHPGAGRVHTQVYPQCTKVLGLNEGLQDVPITDGFHSLISPNPEQTKQACKKPSRSVSYRRKNPNKGKGDQKPKRSTDYEGKNQRFDLEPQDTSPMLIDIPKGSKRKLTNTF